MKCAHCSTEFNPTRKTQIYCSVKCKNDHQQLRRRQIYQALKHGRVPEYRNAEMLRSLITSLESILNNLKQQEVAQ